MSKDTTTVILDVIDREQPLDAERVEDLESLVQAANARSSLRSKLSRAANILRYYRTTQLLQRALRTAVPASRSLRSSSFSNDETAHVRKHTLERIRGIATTRTERTTVSGLALCDDLTQGRFTFLAQPFDLGMPVDWGTNVTPRPSHLWRFHLHYHEYLLDLALGSAAEGAEDVQAWPTIWRIVADWINSHAIEPSQRSDEAWHPYCISRRLPVWAQLFALCDPPEDLYESFLRSFACQAEVLSRSLEFDLGGNHLLENLRALALAGAFLDGEQSERWLDLATQHYRKQLPIQILPHGEHYERAPMYHCQVLGNLLQVAFATEGVREDLAKLCRQAAVPMRDFLLSILHSDGEIPFFGDSCQGEAHAVKDITALAELVRLDPYVGSKSSTTVVGRYWSWRDAGDTLIFDAGAVGARSLPAHAHCDLLGFEASVAGQRWFVDSGLFDYDEGAMRDYCRSSAAHNVVTVDHQNCCDVWSRFRMGRRGRPTRFLHGQQGNFSWCQASHDGYRHLGVPEISRLLVIHTSGVWTCLEFAKKTSGSSLVGRLHLAPGIQLQQDGPQGLLLTREGIQRWLTVTPGVKLGQAEGWYCDRFGQRTRTQVITYRPSEPPGAGCTFGWSLSPSAEFSASVIIEENATGLVQIAMGDDPKRFHWQFPNGRVFRCLA